MSGISRFISFVIGLIVLVLLFILIANRFNANRASSTSARAITPTPTRAPSNGGGFFGLFKRNTPTPSPTIVPAPNTITLADGTVVIVTPTPIIDPMTGQVAPSVTPVAPTPTPEKKGFDLFGIFRRNTPTPSPTPTLTFAQQMNTTMGSADAQYQSTTPGQQMNQQNIKNIPNTGTPTLVLPIASAMFGLGVYLRRRK